MITNSGSDKGFPRTRGDGPPAVDHRRLPILFPPHTRGWTLRGLPLADARRVSPAHAGMDRSLSTTIRLRFGFPRTRGDGPSTYVSESSWLKFPPHTRGWTAPPPAVRKTIFVSPAHAGMDPVPDPRPSCSGGFPRTRGDGPDTSSGCALSPRFPPHTRGWTAAHADAPWNQGVSPAHAGMDLLSCRARGVTCSFPRTRGDGPL